MAVNDIVEWQCRPGLDAPHEPGVPHRQVAPARSPRPAGVLRPALR
jgi:hypothetical protein